MKKKIYYELGIFSGILISFFIRFPFIPHEQGWDSFIIHRMSQSISNYGYMKWILHPFSYIGYYPYSYASGIPIFLSTFSQLSGLDMEYSILVFCFFESILFFIFSYMAASVFTNRFIFRIFAALAYSLSPGVIWFTDWTISTRGPLIMLIPLFIFSLFKINKDNKLSKKYILLSTLILFTAASIHNMYIFFILILLSYILSVFLLSIKKKVLPSNKTFLFIFIHKILPISLILFFLFLVYVPIFLNININLYKTINLKSLFEISKTYGGKVGILFLLMPIGVVYLFFKKTKNITDIFLISNFFLLAPIFLSPYYVSLGFLFLLVFLSIYALIPLLKENKKIKYIKIKKIILFFIIVIVISWGLQSKFHLVSTHGEKLDRDYCEEPTYEASIVLRHMENGGFISNDHTLHGRIEAYSGRKNIVDYTYIINGYVNLSNINIKTKENIFDWFNNGPYVDTHQIILEYRYWSPFKNMPKRYIVNTLIYKYDIKYYIENINIYGKINYYNKGIYQSEYFTYLDKNQYALYENEKISIRYFR